MHCVVAYLLDNSVLGPKRIALYCSRFEQVDHEGANAAGV